MDKAVHQLDALSSLAETQGVGPAREDWRRQRRRMEAAEEKHTPRGVKERRHWVAFRRLLALFGVGLRLSGLYKRGVRNALDIKLKRIELRFENLPSEFDGYRILQLSDPHVDFLAGPMDTALELISGEPVDLCVLTGDYRKRVSGPFEHILPAFEKLVAQSRAMGSTRSSATTTVPTWQGPLKTWVSTCSSTRPGAYKGARRRSM